MKPARICAVLLAALAVAGARADELRLRDGTKIVGTIVGFENDHFKVETPYGYALVRKDKIESIIFTESKKETPATQNKKSPAAQKPAPGQGATAGPSNTTPPSPSPAAERPFPAPTSNPPVTPSAPAKSPPQAGEAPGMAPSAVPAAPAEPKISPAAPAGPAPAPKTPAPKPAAPPAEPPMREAVEGNTYINQTYGFRMYKPPGWRVIEEARKRLPSAIVAMGTDDENTLLVVGRAVLRGTLDEHVAATERELREIYENYRVVSQERSVIAGQPALRRRFRGIADERDWSGILVSLGRGNEVFTILGMTYADSDLIQIQENVIAKTVASLEFLK